jgi:hypothetical protein
VTECNTLLQFIDNLQWCHMMQHVIRTVALKNDWIVRGCYADIEGSQT